MSAMDERTGIRSRNLAGLSRLAGPWWVFLLTGIGWLILAWIALRFAPASIPTVGVLLGVYFLVATINEFFISSVMPGWRWLHILLGIIFAFGAIWSFVHPYDAFWALASILGLLLIFQGTLYIVTSVSTREVNSMWWLGLVVGILEILLGFWASQQYRPVQGALLLLWVGFFALFRGISEIVLAFELRHAQHA
jgi:uncharacterized membrane protein HdeD (DUF308 family)